MEAKAELFERLYPEEFIAKCFDSGIRPDARKLMQPRPVSINWTQSGACLVKIGTSSALATVKLAVGTPALATPDQGEIDLQVLLAGVCASKFSTQRTTDEAQSLSSYLTRTLLSSKCIDLRDCCIERGKSAWKLLVEVTFLDHDGNAMDTAMLATMAVLSKLKIPAISIAPDSIVSLAEDQTANSPFPLHQTLISTSFGEYRTHLVVDPTAQEEEHLSSSFSILYTTDGEFAGVYKAGGQPLSPATLHQCIQAAKDRSAQFAALLKSQSSD
ncbi:Exosome complex component RRP43 [Aphanomyces cochlioides]|nr:Exosome complex component RRP43 [Aphanomyces cochlioides]